MSADDPFRLWAAVLPYAALFDAVLYLGVAAWCFSHPGRVPRWLAHGLPIVAAVALISLLLQQNPVSMVSSWCALIAVAAARRPVQPS